MKCFSCNVILKFLFLLLVMAATASSVQAAVFDFDRVVQQVQNAHEHMVERSLDEARDWMRKQPDPLLRALAVLPSKPYRENDGNDAEQFLSQPLRQILASNPSPASLHFLALACEQRLLMPQCIDAGLVDAVNDVDPVNFATWSIVYQGQPQKMLDKLEQADRFDSFQFDAIEAWYKALQVSSQPISKEFKQHYPMALVLAIATPAYGPIFEVCETAAEAGSDSDLVRGCVRVSQYLLDQSTTIMERTMGYGLRAEIAKFEQSPDADAVEQKRQAFHDLVQCQSLAHVDLEFDSELTETYLKWLFQFGEVKALEMLAQKQGIDCA